MKIKERQKLRSFINKLALIRGRHTELVSVYIPAGYELQKIIAHLQQEQGTASNIKDARTRKNVQDSLEKLIRHLRLFRKTPNNGLAVFSGNISEQEGKTDIQVFSVEPPEPIGTRLYRCDHTFVLDLLKNMLEHKEIYGLVVVDKREATLGILKGTAISKLTKLTSGVPGKIKAGGQCISPRTLVNNGNLIEIKNIKVGDKIESYDINKREVTDSICLDKWFIKKENYLIIKTTDKQIICSKDHIFFVNDNKEIKQKPAEKLKLADFLMEKNCKTKIKSIDLVNQSIELVDIAVKQGNFIANGLIVHNSAQRFARAREGAAKEFYKRIAEACNKEFLGKENLKGIILGGPGPSKEEFLDYLNQQLKDKIIGVKDITYTDEQGLYDLVDKSQDTLAKEVIAEEKAIMLRFFTLLAKEPNKVSYGLEEVKKALNYSAVEILLLSEDLDEKLIDEFEQKAEAIKAEVQLISLETREGTQLKELGGIAAILRFAIE